MRDWHVPAQNEHDPGIDQLGRMIREHGTAATTDTAGCPTLLAEYLPTMRSAALLLGDFVDD
jgi:hypothetical protein